MTDSDWVWGMEGWPSVRRNPREHRSLSSAPFFPDPCKRFHDGRNPPSIIPVRCFPESRAKLIHPALLVLTVVANGELGPQRTGRQTARLSPSRSSSADRAIRDEKPLRPSHGSAGISIHARCGWPSQSQVDARGA